MIFVNVALVFHLTMAFSTTKEFIPTHENIKTANFIGIHKNCVRKYIQTEDKHDWPLSSTFWIHFKDYFYIRKQIYHKDICHIDCTFKDETYDFEFIMMSLFLEVSVHMLTVECLNNAALHFNANRSIHIFLEKARYIRILNCIIINPDTIPFWAFRFMKDIYIPSLSSYRIEIMNMEEAAFLHISARSKDGLLIMMGQWHVIEGVPTDHSIKNFPAYIKLTNCKISCLPNSLLKLPVTVLDLAGNGIIQADGLFVPNSHISNEIFKIILTSNEISFLNIFCKSNISQLVLSRNRITHLKRGTFRNLWSLNFLDLSWNQIRYVEPGTFQQSPLSIINLSHNYLQQLSYVQVPLIPCILNLSFNKFLKPPFQDSEYVVPAVINVDIRGNPFECDCNITSFNQFLLEIQDKPRFPTPLEKIMNIRKISDELFLQLQDVLCREPISLRGIPLSNISFNRICPVLEHCPTYCICDFIMDLNITNVNCSENNLLDFPDYLPAGTLNLLFQGNAITSLPHRHFLSRLTMLNISRNSLTEISISVFKHVETIDLSHNKLQSLPKDLIHTNTSHIRFLDLRNNPWLCTCEDRWLMTWLSEHIQTLVTREVHCANDQMLILPVSNDDMDCELHWCILLIIFFLPGSIVYVTVYIYVSARQESLQRNQKERLNPEEDKLKTIDAYILYVPNDEEWTRQHIIDPLKGSYRLFDYERHGRGNHNKRTNMDKNITKSKRAIFIVSNAFLRDDNQTIWYQLMSISQENEQFGGPEMIGIIIEDISKNPLIEKLYIYLPRGECINSSNPKFMKRLVEFLPPKDIEENRNLVV